MPVLQVYLADGERHKIKQLARHVDMNGIANLRDQRGNISLSALVRWLVDEKLAELGDNPQSDEQN